MGIVTTLVMVLVQVVVLDLHTHRHGGQIQSRVHIPRMCTL